MRTQVVLFIAVLVIALLDRLKHRFALFALFALPSTLAHELMHFSVALLLGGKPAGLHLWPERQGNSYHLGHVVVRNSTWLNTGPIALAPLLLIPLAWIALGHVPVRPTPWQMLLWGGLLGSLLYGALPSGTDWQLAWRAPISTAIVLCTAAGLVWWTVNPYAFKWLLSDAKQSQSIQLAFSVNSDLGLTTQLNKRYQANTLH